MWLCVCERERKGAAAFLLHLTFDQTINDTHSTSYYLPLFSFSLTVQLLSCGWQSAFFSLGERCRKVPFLSIASLLHDSISHTQAQSQHFLPSPASISHTHIQTHTLTQIHVPVINFLMTKFSVMVCVVVIDPSVEG